MSQLRNAGVFSIQLIGPPKQMKQQMKQIQKDADESDKNMSDLKHKM